MSRPNDPYDVSASDPNGDSEDGLAGSMGVSSERVGKMRGNVEPGTHGVELTGSSDTGAAPEPNPDDARTPDQPPA
ncbi:MAG: hypothetical protein ACJ72D_27510 [Marmoricola sp.]